MKQIRYFILTLFCLASAFASAQNKTMTGTVVEDLGGYTEPIYGANVVVINSQNRTLTGTITDLDGNFVLSVPAAEKGISIQVSFIGLSTQTFPYTGQPTLNVTMSSNAQQLQDVEVVTKRVERDGLGVSFKEQTAATQKINMSEIADIAPVSSIDEALQGQMAGVDIVLGGDPGAKSAIRIRGTSTLSGNADPLIVIDGIPQNVSIGDDFDFSTANEDDFGSLLNISPSDIESIEVLKDASSTAIYGTAGGNGVLLITTKQGKTGKTQFQFQSKYSYKEEPATIPLLNGKQYISMIEDAIWNAANAKGLGSARNELDLLFNTRELLRDPNYRYYNEYNVDTDWLGEVKQNAWSLDNNFSVSGGGDKATYRFSLGYLDDIGTTIGTQLQRITTQLKVTYKFSDRLRVYTDFAYTGTDKEGNAVENVRAQAQGRMPNRSPYYVNDDGSRSVSYFSPESDFQGSWGGVSNSKGQGNWNPVAMAKEGYKNTKVREEKMTINLQYRFPFHLTYEGYVSMNMKTQRTKTFFPQVATGVLWTSNYANRSEDDITDNFSLRTENKLLYANTFNEKHSLVATAVARTTSSHSASASNATYGNVSANLSDPVVGSIVDKVASGESDNRRAEFIGQFVYTYDNRYVLRATVNTEGNSAMGKENRFGTFPAFGAAWNIYEEPWMENQDWMTEGKLRFGLGWSGRAPSSGYAYLGAYTSMGEYMDMPAIRPDRMQLDKLKWESNREWDLGVDLRLWDRFSVTLDYYDKYTKDNLIEKVSIPSTTGYAQLRWANSGEMSNKGYELRFDYDIFKNKDWKVSMNFNMARNINKVEKLPENYSFENYSFGNGKYAIRIVEGDPIGSFYGYRYKGVYQNEEDTYAYDAAGNVMRDFAGNVVKMKNGTTQVFPGDAKYEDVNHDGVINQNDIVYLGNSNPTLTGGAGVSLRYGSNKHRHGLFTLTTFFHGRFGQKVINQARMDLESMYGTNNQSTAVLSRWRKEGDDTDIPRALYGMGYNYLGSDRFVENNSYVRLKTLSLSWTMPKDWFAKTSITNLNVFITGYDLFTWTKYSGQNPEVALPSNPTKLVTDGSTTPVSKRLAAGVTINF